MSLSSAASISSTSSIWNGSYTGKLGATSHHLHLSLPSNKLQKTIICSAAAAKTAAVMEQGGSQSESALSRISSLSQVSGVLGCQWGDEGKGKLVDILAKQFDVVARCQG